MEHRRAIIGVMGAGENATADDAAMAFELGKRIAAEGWIVLSGGRAAGVMDSVNKGAKEAGGLTIGIIPDKNSTISEAVDVAIMTDMGQARNNINVLSSDVVVACGNGGAGTVAEVALALKAGKTVVLLRPADESAEFFSRLGKDRMRVVQNVDETISLLKEILNR